MNTRTRANLLLLAGCQALMGSAVAVVLTTGSLVGHQLASDKGLATLPLALMIVGSALATVPASLLMHRVGRRVGFMVGAAIGLVAGVGACFALSAHSFLLFGASMLVLGMSRAFASYYRFAAADAVAADDKANAISLVMAGGVLSGVVGPTLARWSRSSIPGTHFLGSMVVLAVLMALVLIVLAFLRMPEVESEDLQKEQRPLRSIMNSSRFVVAVLGASVGGMVMTLLMTATPLAMDHYHHGFDATATVIQWHVVAMFLPSFVTGKLIQRFGVLNIMLVGALATLSCLLIAMAGTSEKVFALSLILLGVGWNFLFVGGSSLLTSVHNHAERAKTQAANDFIIVIGVAAASLGSGQLQHHFGWPMLIRLALPAVVLVIAALLWQRGRDTSEPSG